MCLITCGQQILSHVSCQYLQKDTQYAEICICGIRLIDVIIHQTLHYLHIVIFIVSCR